MSMPAPLHHLARPTGLPPAHGYSHAVVAAAGSEVVAVSGQLPAGADGTLVGADDALAQAHQVFANLARALAAAGSDAGHVLRLGFYLTDLGDLGAVRAARDAFLGEHPEPASSLVQVAGLVLPGARLEVDALAVRRRG